MEVSQQRICQGSCFPGLIQARKIFETERPLPLEKITILFQWVCQTQATIRYSPPLKNKGFSCILPVDVNQGLSVVIGENHFYVFEKFLDAGTYSWVYLVKEYATKKLGTLKRLPPPTFRAMKISRYSGNTYQDEETVLRGVPHSLYIDRFIRVFKLAYSETSVAICNFYPMALDTMGEKLIRNAAILKKLFFCIAQGLEVLHKSGKLHTDIKPDNILVGDGLTAALTDFGGLRDSADPKPYTPTTHYANLYQYHYPYPVEESYQIVFIQGCAYFQVFSRIETQEGVLVLLRNAWNRISWPLPTKESDLFAFGRTMETILRSSLGLPDVIEASFKGAFSDEELMTFSYSYPNRCHYAKVDQVDQVYVHLPLEERRLQMLSKVSGHPEEATISSLVEICLSLQVPPQKSPTIDQVIYALSSTKEVTIEDSILATANI